MLPWWVGCKTLSLTDLLHLSRKKKPKQTDIDPTKEKRRNAISKHYKTQHRDSPMKNTERRIYTVSTTQRNRKTFRVCFCAFPDAINKAPKFCSHGFFAERVTRNILFRTALQLIPMIVPSAEQTHHTITYIVNADDSISSARCIRKIETIAKTLRSWALSLGVYCSDTIRFKTTTTKRLSQRLVQQRRHIHYNIITAFCPI